MAQKIPSSSDQLKFNYCSVSYLGDDRYGDNYQSLHNRLYPGVKDFPISKEVDKEICDFWQAYKEKHFGDSSKTPPK